MNTYVNMHNSEIAEPQDQSEDPQNSWDGVTHKGWVISMASDFIFFLFYFFLHRTLKTAGAGQQRSEWNLFQPPAPDFNLQSSARIEMQKCVKKKKSSNHTSFPLFAFQKSIEDMFPPNYPVINSRKWKRIQESRGSGWTELPGWWQRSVPGGQNGFKPRDSLE